MTELKPCPFCGKEAEPHEVNFPYHYWDVLCDGECFEHFCEEPTRERAVKRWNRRSATIGEDEGGNDVNGHHDSYFISFEDKDWDWEETTLHKSCDDLGEYVREAEGLRDCGNRNVKVMELVTVERVVREVS